MSPLRSAFVLVSAVLLGAVPAMAQQTRPSPPGITGAVIDGNRVTVYYSRPFTKDPKTGEARKIWGGLVPFGKVWRFGANEATLLVTQKPIEIGGTTVPAGVYSLFMLPNEGESSKLIINKQYGQHGTEYDEKQDLVRIDLKQEPAAKPVDQFTVTVGRNGNAGVLTIAWEQTQYSVPFTTKK